MAKNNLDDLRFQKTVAHERYKNAKSAQSKQYAALLEGRASRQLRDAEREELKVRRGSVARFIFATVICMLLALYFIRSVVGVGTPDFSFTRLLSGLSEWTNSIDLAVQPVKWNLPNWLQWLNDFANLIWLPLGYGANFISALISFVVYVFQFFLFS